MGVFINLKGTPCGFPSALYPGHVGGGKSGLVSTACAWFRKSFVNESDYGQVTHGCYVEK